LPTKSSKIQKTQNDCENGEKNTAN
jgi:hypothetical protein